MRFLLYGLTILILVTGFMSFGSVNAEKAESIENATINETEFTEDFSKEYDNKPGAELGEEWAEAFGLTVAKLMNGAATYSYNNNAIGPREIFNLTKYALYALIIYLLTKTAVFVLSALGVNYEVFN